MNTRNFSERSWPLSKRLKFLRVCLRVLQRRLTCSCYVVMPSSRTSTSSPKFFLQWGQLRLKVTMWWVLNQRSFKLVSGPSDKLIGWRARRWLSPSRENPRPAQRGRHPRRRLLDLQCLTGWAPLHPHLRGLSHRSHPFELAPEGPVHDPFKEARSLARLLHLPQPDNVHPSKHQFPDQEQPTGPSASRRCLADEGSHRASHQCEVPRVLQSVVPGTQEDRKSATCNRPVPSQPPHGTVEPLYNTVHYRRY